MDRFGRALFFNGIVIASDTPQRIRDTLVGVDTVSVLGRLRSIVGLAIEADVPGARIG